MSRQTALTRLERERKDWRKDHPNGFYARPRTAPDNSVDLMNWECGIPGKEGTPWESGLYRVAVHFTDDYPIAPPQCLFKPVIFHPNVFSSGHICLSILKPEGGWAPSIGIKDVLIGIQQLLTEPNPLSPANGLAAELFACQRPEYDKRVRAQATSMKPKDGA